MDSAGSSEGSCDNRYKTSPIVPPTSVPLTRITVNLSPDVKFNLPRHIAGIPAFHRIADVAGQEGGKLRRHPMGGLLQMAVERSAQRIVGDQRFAKPLSGMRFAASPLESSALISCFSH